MMKAIRCLALLVVFALAAWASVPGTAHAIPSCESYDGDSCSQILAGFGCMWSDGRSGQCTCDGTTWRCS